MTPSATMTALPEYAGNGDGVLVQEKGRVAFFQAYWRMHSNVAYAALLLAEAGFGVDIFLMQVDDFLVEETLRGVDNISVHRLDAKGHIAVKQPAARPVSRLAGIETREPRPARSLRSRFRRVARKWYTTVRRGVDAEFGLLPVAACDYALEMTRRHRYKAIIGVEKGGLLWAGRTSQKSKTPLMYFSLELYTRDHSYCRKPFRRRLKVAEEKYHRLCSATIVQDERRAKVLLEDNGVADPMDLFLVPISRLNGPIKSNSNWLQRNLGLFNDTSLILVHGLISTRRLSTELAKAAQNFSHEWKLVFHGWGSDETIAEIRAIDRNDRVRLSLDLVPPSQEAEVVRSAHIGVVIYDDKDINDRLTAFASEKIALYLQCGLPIIAFNYEGYEHITRERCGVLIESIADLPAAARLIMDDYAGYRSRAFSCFERYYSFEKNYEKVIEALAKLP